MTSKHSHSSTQDTSPCTKAAQASMMSVFNNFHSTTKT